MAVLERTGSSRKHLSSQQQQLNPQQLDSQLLPLQRIYACESAWAAQPLFTQPLRGELTDWTWASAMAEVRRIAAWIGKQNWPPGSRIVIFSKNCAWWLMADWAIWMSGHVSVPLFPASRDASLAALFRHCQPVACFLGMLDHPLPLQEDAFDGLTYVAFPNVAAGHLPPECLQWGDLVCDHAPVSENPLRPIDDVATIIYTSGTTGQPKGAMHSFQALSMMGKSMEPAFQAKAGKLDRMLSYLPLAHIAERAIIEMNALFMPLHIFFAESQDTFLTDLKRARCTLFFSIPRLFIRFQHGVFEKMPEHKLDRLLRIPILGRIVRRKILRGLGLDRARLVAGGGAATPVEIILWYRKMGVNFVEGYGMTETGITHVPLPGRERVGYVGNASPYADTRISPEGEVQIKGQMNMLGYYRNPELTQQAFTQDGYFRTGDHGEIDALGRLRLIGRLKEEFKTAKGKFVVPGHVEELLALSLLFESVAVFGAGMTSPFVLAVLASAVRDECRQPEKRAVLERELISVLDQVNSRLEHHEQLRFIVLCREPWTPSNGLLTPTLKVRRSALEQKFSPSFNAWEKSQIKVIWLPSQ